MRALEDMAARAFGVADASCVVAAGGSEAVLRLMPYVLRVDEAVIVGPTYSSHEDAWRKAGARISINPDPNPPSRRFGTAGEGLREGADKRVVTVVNPNNPDGAALHRDHLLALHDQLARDDGYLVVDEAFADADPSCSVASLAGRAQHPRLLVLRSFGKFYGLAGLRLGFAIAPRPIAQRFRSLLGDWPVTADAIAAGLAAYADAAWAERTRARLQSAAQSLDSLLLRSGFTIVGGTALFRLARSHDARHRFERLLDAGILVRPFDHDATLLRFGLPYGAAAWQRLTRALGAEA